MQTNYIHKPLTKQNLKIGMIVFQHGDYQSNRHQVTKIEEVSETPPTDEAKNYLITATNVDTGNTNTYSSSVLFEMIVETKPYKPEPDQNPPIS